MTSEIRMERLLGLPAVLGGRPLGHVERAVLEEDGHALRGLIVRRGFSGARWIGREGIELLGSVSIILRQKPQRLPDSTDFRLRNVKDTRGATLGCVTDAFLSPADLHVCAIEVTLGLLEDLRSGRKQVQQFSTLPNGDVLIPEGEIMESGAKREPDLERSDPS